MDDFRAVGLDWKQSDADTASGTTRELVARAGHRTTAAAMTYQHVADERNALAADRMDALAGTALGQERMSRLEAVFRLELPGT